MSRVKKASQSMSNIRYFNFRTIIHYSPFQKSFSHYSFSYFIVPRSCTQFHQKGTLHWQLILISQLNYLPFHPALLTSFIDLFVHFLYLHFSTYFPIVLSEFLTYSPSSIKSLYYYFNNKFPLAQIYSPLLFTFF